MSCDKSDSGSGEIAVGRGRSFVGNMVTGDVMKEKMGLRTLMGCLAYTPSVSQGRLKLCQMWPGLALLRGG